MNKNTFKLTTILYVFMHDHTIYIYSHFLTWIFRTNDGVYIIFHFTILNLNCVCIDIHERTIKQLPNRQQRINIIIV